MKVSIIWWELDESEQTIDSLREYLRDEGVQPWTAIAGLHQKFWVADRENNRWGAVTVWESAEAAERPMPPQRATELIGYPPAQRQHFGVEATVEGGHFRVAPAGVGPTLAT